MPSFWKPDYQLQAKMQHRYESMFQQKQYFKLGMRHLLRCNRYLIPSADGGTGKALIITSGKARVPKYVGLQQCHNAWSCPVCAPRVLATYKLKLNVIFDQAIKQGYSLRMITFTVPHYADESADTVLMRLLDTYNKFNTYKRVMTHQKSFEAKTYGSVVATECKHSKIYGFHFHRHTVYLVKDNAAFERDFVKMRNWWQAYIEQFKKTDAPNKHSEGMYLSPQCFTTANYIAKLTNEMAKPGQEKKFSRDMFELLTTNSEDDLKIFAEFACAVHGHRRIQRSNNLLKLLGLNSEQLDKAVQEQALLGEFGDVKTVASFAEDSWRKILEAEHDDNKPHRHYLLFRAQLDGIDGVRRYCAENKLPQPLAITQRLIIERAA